MKYHNPWHNHPGFVDLGELHRAAEHIEHYDLYAIVSSSRSISFGARYGNKDSAYLSGTAYLNSSGEWELYIHDQTALAAARFFANFHPSKSILPG